jgi:tRNA(Ile)-lysidine synthase
MSTIHAKGCESLAQRILLQARRLGMIPTTGQLLVAVSGGPDSVGLLAVLQELQSSGRLPGVTLRVAHMNYRLRGAESDDDEAFVRELGSRWQIPVDVEYVRLENPRKTSLRAQARNCRYAFFERLCKAHHPCVVATGHTAEDHAETILMWLVRGCGPAGLAGIPMTRGQTIIRPLLQVRRAEILAYLASRQLTYRIDSTNATPIYQRNRMRHDLIPQLQTFNPRVVEALCRTSELLRDDAALLQEVEDERWSAIVTKSEPGRVIVDASGFSRTSISLQRRFVKRAWHLLRGTSADLTYRHVTTVLESIVSRSGDGSVDLPAGVRAFRTSNEIQFVSVPPHGMPAGPSWASGQGLPVPGMVSVGQGQSVRADVVCAETCIENPGYDPSSFTIDGALVVKELIVRRRRPGDWFCPTGMHQHRKTLQDFFVDQKVPRHRRDHVPLVVAPAGIVWVAGYRGDERFRPQRGSKTVIRLSLGDER